MFGMIFRNLTAAWTAALKFGGVIPLDGLSFTQSEQELRRGQPSIRSVMFFVSIAKGTVAPEPETIWECQGSAKLSTNWDVKSPNTSSKP